MQRDNHITLYEYYESTSIYDIYSSRLFRMTQTPDSNEWCAKYAYRVRATHILHRYQNKCLSVCVCCVINRDSQAIRTEHTSSVSRSESQPNL